MATATGKRTERIALRELTPSEYNPREISADHMRRLKASISEHTNALADWRTSDGYRMATTITVNRNGNRIVGGHMRVEALRALGQEWIHAEDVTWVDIVPLSATEKELNIALNNREMQGDWDGAKLAQVLADIKLEAGAIYDGLELDLLEAAAATSDGRRAGKTDPDSVPEPQDPPLSAPGKTYALGQHRVFCGDCTSRRDISALLCGEMAQALITDPPYNVGYVAKTSAALSIRNDDMPEADYRRFLARAFSSGRESLAEGGAFYVWYADSHAVAVRMAMRDADLQPRQGLVWVKPSHVLGRQDYHWRHEPCLYGWKDGSAHFWRGGRSQNTVLEFDKPSRNADHPTMKPVALMEELIENSTRDGDRVLDLFGGSGTTLLAAERMGRRAFLSEIDPIYCDVIRRRWAEFIHGEGCDWQRLSPEA